MQDSLYLEPAVDLVASIICTVAGIALVVHGVIRFRRNRRSR